jgi:hypothetical protein
MMMLAWAAGRANAIEPRQCDALAFAKESRFSPLVR